jgi:hypothetical protein
MRKILSAEESSLLLAYPETSHLISRMVIADENYVLEGTAEQFDELRDAVSDVLLRTGFDKNYDPTEEGTVLEGLIDKFFIG